MYIHRIILRDVKSIEHLDITFHDDWRNEPLKSILLTGPNGSGKTTILKVIAALWENFGKWLYAPKALSRQELAQSDLLLKAGLVAIEIYDLVSEPVWLYMDRGKKYADELNSIVQKEAIRVGQGSMFSRTYAGSSIKFSQWADAFKAKRQRLLTTGSETSLLPNLVFLDAEIRFIYQETGKKVSDFERFYDWLVTYSSLTDVYGNLNKLLSNLKVRSPESFYQFVEQANSFLGEKKQLTDFDGELRLRVELTNGSKKFHYIEDLSSGEQQCLLLMYLASRWLMPGGIMLLDEPDLHLHESLQRHFLRELQKVVVDEKQGQLIVTSHSPTLWKEYGEAQSFDLGEKVHG